MKRCIRLLAGFWIVCTIITLLVGCAGTAQSATSEMDGYWLECELAWTESSIADLQGTTDMAAIRDFERSLEMIGSQTLLDAYDQYLAVLSDYMYSDTPEYMWEQEWQEVVDSEIAFQKVYAAELRTHLENR